LYRSLCNMSPNWDVGTCLESVRQGYLTEKQRMISAASWFELASTLIWYLAGLMVVGLAPTLLYA
jgi:hypothetical protein